ncbi:hypothetical protein LQV05_004465 [Cryptococcus neoformans]|nr:hypothetical protein LQV05_004465 [Cryptococcus neoformans]
MSTLSGSSAQSALWSTLSSIISIPYKIYSSTRVLYQEYQQWYDTNQPLFIFDTELSFEWTRIKAKGELRTDNPCIEYYYFAGDPDPDHNDYHFMRFTLEDGTTVRTPIPSSSILYIGAEGVLQGLGGDKAGCDLFRGAPRVLKAWENPAEPKYGDQMLRVGAILKKWEAYLGQCNFNVGPLPNLHEEGFDEEWFDLWDRLKPDPEKFAPYHLPLERPYPYKDIALRRKKITGENQER